jgi:hypothetical protein
MYRLRPHRAIPQLCEATLSLRRVRRGLIATPKHKRLAEYGAERRKDTAAGAERHRGGYV